MNSSGSTDNFTGEAGEVNYDSAKRALTKGLHWVDNASKALEQNLDDKPLSDSESGVDDGRSAHWLNQYSSGPSSMLTPKSTPSDAITAVHSSNPFLMTTSIGAYPNAYIYVASPPSTSELTGSLHEYTLPDKIHRDAYYSNESDAPDKAREYAGLLYHLKGGDGLAALEEWCGGDSHIAVSKVHARAKIKFTAGCGNISSGGWEYASCPPGRREIKKWLTTDTGRPPIKASKAPSQVESLMLLIMIETHPYQTD